MKYFAMLILFILMFTPLFAIFKFIPMPTGISADDISDYIQKRRDYGQKINTISKERFVEAIKGGQFINKGPDEIYKSEKYPYDKELGLYDGSFSTKDGKVYLWSMPRRNVIEINDSSYRTGWIIITKDISKFE